MSLRPPSVLPFLTLTGAATNFEGGKLDATPTGLCGQRFRAKWLSGVAALLGALAAGPRPERRSRSRRRLQPADLFQPDRDFGRRPARVEREPGRRQCLGAADRHQHGAQEDRVGDEPQSVALDPNNSIRLRRQRGRQQRYRDQDHQCRIRSLRRLGREDREDRAPSRGTS